MKTLARVTAVLLIAVGGVLLLAAVLGLLVTWARGGMAANPSPFFGQYRLFLRAGQVMLAGWAGVSGLVLAAFGQMLWLLADLVDLTRAAGRS